MKPAFLKSHGLPGFSDHPKLMTKKQKGHGSPSSGHKAVLFIVIISLASWEMADYL